MSPPQENSEPGTIVLGAWYGVDDWRSVPWLVSLGSMPYERAASERVQADLTIILEPLARFRVSRLVGKYDWCSRLETTEVVWPDPRRHARRFTIQEGATLSPCKPDASVKAGEGEEGEEDSLKIRNYNSLFVFATEGARACILRFTHGSDGVITAVITALPSRR